jgi:hypothetical protein
MEAGCYIQGSWGQYAMGRLCSFAESQGWVNEYSVNEDSQKDIDLDLLVELADEAELWLNENVAPENHSFGWVDGEFMLLTTADWQSL